MQLNGRAIDRSVVMANERNIIGNWRSVHPDWKKTTRVSDSQSFGNKIESDRSLNRMLMDQNGTGLVNLPVLSLMKLQQQVRRQFSTSRIITIC